MTTDTTQKLGYWREDPDTGEWEWIEGSYPPKKPEMEEPREPEEPMPPIGTPEHEAWMIRMSGLPPIEPVEPPTLPVIPELPTVDIAELSQLYNIPAMRFVTPEMLADLALPPEERAVTWHIPYEMYLTWEQARYLGYDVPEGSVVRMTPMADGEPSFFLMPMPEAELRPELEVNLAILREVYPEQFDPSRSFGYSLEDIPAMVVANLQNWMVRDYQGFVDDLYNRVGQDEAENILRMLGVTEEFILLTLDVKEQETRFVATIQGVFPDFEDIVEFNEFVNTDWDLFVETIQTGGSSSEKRTLLEYMGYNPDQINSFFNVIRVIDAVDGVRQQLIIDVPRMKAYDREGNWVGTYNVVTREFTALPDEVWIKDVWDAFVYGGQHLYHQAKQFVVSSLPEFLFPDMPDVALKIFGREWVIKANTMNREIRDEFRRVYTLNQNEWEDWVAKHPELAPSAWERQDIVTRVKDNWYRAIMYEFASTAPFMIGVMGTTVLVAKGTGNPLLGILAGMAMATPPEAQDAYDALMAAGATKAQAGQMALPIGVLVAGIEVIGDLPYLRRVFPTVFKMFTKEITEQVAKQAFTAMAKKGLVTFTTIELIETLEEIFQNAVVNAGIKVIDENQEIWEGTGEIALRTILATTPLALFGAGMSLRRVSPSRTQGLTDTAMKAKGWVQDGRGNWYERLKDIVKDERGFVLLPGEPEGVRPEEVTPKAVVPSRGEGGIIIPTTAETHAEGHKKLTIQDAINLAVADTGMAFDELTPAQLINVYANARTIFEMYYESVKIPTGERAGSVELSQETISYMDEGIATLKKAQAEAKKAFVAKSSGDVARANIEKIIPKTVAIPTAEPGMPEPGIQPSMLPEEITAKEVRPPGRGRIVQISMEDQLKLDQARKAAEEAVENKKAYEAQAEAEGIKAYLATEPAGRLTNLIKKTGWYKGEVKNLTLKQYRDITGKTEIKSNILTKDKKHVRWEYALDDIATELGYADGETLKTEIERAGKYQDKVKKLEAEIKTHFTEKPLPALPEVKAEEVAVTPTGERMLTPAQIARTLDLFGKYIIDPSTVNAWELTRELRRETRAGRAENLKARAQELIVEQGMPVEEAMNQAIRETLTGELPVATTDYLSDLTNQMRSVLFSKVYEVLINEPLEMAATITALTNALRGRAIPREPGIRGGSAYTRLQRVFGEQPQVMKALDTIAKEQKPLEQVVEGIYHEVGREPIPVDEQTAEYLRNLPELAFPDTMLPKTEKGVLTFEPTGKLGLKMAAEQMALAVKQIQAIKVTDLRTPTELEFSKRRLELGTQLAEGIISKDVYDIELVGAFNKAFPKTERGRLTFEPTGKLGLELTNEQMGFIIQQIESLKVSDLRTPAELEFAKRKIDLGTQLAEGTIDETRYRIELLEAYYKAYPSPPIPPFEPPIEKVVEQYPLIPRPVIYDIVRVLKEVAWSPIDIGNLIRANIASVDQSFALRQLIWLAPRHRTRWAKGIVRSWKGIWHEQSAEASWVRVQLFPSYAIYAEGVAEGHGDFLRPYRLAKGSKQYEGVEEFGFFKASERLIPRLTGKIPWIKMSERGFVTGINETTMGTFEDYYQVLLRESEMIASGEVKLGKNEVFDIKREMFAYMDYLADVTGRARLGVAKGLAPALNALLFAARFKLGRILTPRHLISSNPRIRRQAWKDFGMMMSFIGGIVALGAMLGLWDVETDWRSPNFGKIRIGNMRIDVWGGYQQLLVFVAQLYSKTGISSITGQEYSVELQRSIWNFLEKSASPIASLLMELYSGKTYRGEVSDIKDLDQWINRLVPFMIQDMYEAFRESDLPPVVALPIAGILGWLGIGIQTYTGDWKENWTKLGLPKFTENLLHGIDEPYYDTADFWADTANQFKGVDITELTAEKGFPEYIRNIAEGRIILEHLNTLPNDKLVALNADPAKGATFTDIRKIWKERQALVEAGDDAEWTVSELQPDGKYKKVTYKGDDAVVAFDKYERKINGVVFKYSQANLGNFSQRQFSLLMQYHSILDPKEQAEFLKKHRADIGVNPRDEYLRTHPDENAQLAVWGQAKILTREAYAEFKRLIKALDIPDNAIPPLTLPPETSMETHFAYEEMVSEGTHGSVEAKLLLLKDHLAAEEAGVDSYIKWRTDSGEPLTLPDKELDYYQLRVDNADLFKQLKEAQEAKDKELIEAIRATKVGDETFHDIERRVDAMGKGTREAPIPPEIVNAYVKHMRIVDETSGNSAEAKLNRYDDPALNEYLMNEDYHGDQKAEPLHEDQYYLDNYLVPKWRIEVDEEYKEKDAEYEAIKDPLPAIQQRLRDEWLAKPENEEYRLNRRKKEAYELSNPDTGERLPIDMIDTYVAYFEIPQKGKRNERFIVENPLFAQKMFDITGKDIWKTRPEDVPAIQYDDIYDQFVDTFELMDAFKDAGSPDYKDNTEKDEDGLTERDRARNALRFDENGRYTEFGLAEIRRDAYGLFVPEQHIEAYVGYYTIVGEGKPANWKRDTGTDLWFEDDWFMMEHMDFYRDVYRDLLGNEKWDFTKVPTRAVFDKYLIYLTLPHRKAKDDYRWENPDLDAWGVIAFDWKPIAEKKRREELTPYERWLEEWAERQKEIEEKLKELEE